MENMWNTHMGDLGGGQQPPRKRTNTNNYGKQMEKYTWKTYGNTHMWGVWGAAAPQEITNKQQQWTTNCKIHMGNMWKHKYGGSGGQQSPRKITNTINYGKHMEK